jgi:heme exporter protein CcmB
MSFLSAAWLVLRKDLLVEVRSREIVLVTLFFSIVCVLVFAFGFVRDGRPPEFGAAAILWATILFAGSLALGRAFERERQGGTLQALLLAPVERSAIYTGKLLGLFVLLAAIEVVVTPLTALLFQAPLFARPFMLASLLLTGTLGFAAVGALFAAMLARSRGRDVLLPAALYPITLPVAIAGVRGVAALLESPPDEATAQLWLSILVTFDAVFVTAALWTFEPLMTE